MTGDRLKRLQRPLLIAASVIVHVVLLGGLILSGVGDRLTLIPSSPSILYVEIEPRALLEDERPRARRTPAPPSQEPRRPFPRRRVLGFDLPFQREPDQPVPPLPVSPPAAPASPTTGSLPSDALAERVAQGLRTRAACASPHLLSREEQSLCEARFAERAAAAPPISGTGDAGRDARFARQGARALAAYEERREVRAMERPVCPKTGPVADCEVEIQVDIFSTVDGWFPNQQRED